MKKPPAHWKRASNIVWPPGSGNEAAQVWEHQLIPLRVLYSVATMEDGSDWHHVSVSAGGRLPSWTELSKVKDEFLGPEAEAYQVLARRSEHVNVGEVLHLWAPVDGVRRVANLHGLVNERAS